MSVECWDGGLNIDVKEMMASKHRHGLKSRMEEMECCWRGEGEKNMGLCWEMEGRRAGR